MQQPADTKRTSGFTLLEMMLACMLSGVILAGLWQMSSSYIRLFEVGQEKAQESRLARAVLDQLAEDLQGVVNVSLVESRKQAAMPLIGKTNPQTESDAGFEPEDESSLESDSGDSTPSLFSLEGDQEKLPQFSLIGTSEQLQINTHLFKLPEPDFESDETGATNESSSTGGSSDVPSGSLEEFNQFAPEMVTVSYDFTEHELGEAGASKLPVGLIRRELDWQSQEPADTNELTSGLEENTELASETETYLSEEDLEAMELSEIRTADLENEAFLWVPEITKLSFRYFDGSSWSESWNSTFRQSLPIAIEVSLDLEFQKGLDARYPLDEDGEGDALTPVVEEGESAELDEENSESGGILEEEDLPQYRRILFLQAGTKPESNSEETSSISDLLEEE